MRRQVLIALATLALLAACGKKVILKPGEGHVMPPKGETTFVKSEGGFVRKRVI